jgi:hypothetical protein
VTWSPSALVSFALAVSPVEVAVSSVDLSGAGSLLPQPAKSEQTRPKDNAKTPILFFMIDSPPFLVIGFHGLYVDGIILASFPYQVNRKFEVFCKFCIFSILIIDFIRTISPLYYQSFKIYLHLFHNGV